MTAETTAARQVHGDAQAEPGDWHALHIFYSADARPVLTDCVAPLVAELRERGLLGGYFFINYWLEGTHVRLRLKPRTRACTAEVLTTAEAAIREFLARRPALYEADYSGMADFHEQMFTMEYSDSDRLRMYPDGQIPIQDNNSFAYRAYEPEYDKYGGMAGVELAEWHFEHSSDLVLDLVQTTNVHVRPVMLGLSAQLMMIMTATFLRDVRQIANYLDRYYNYWSTSFDISSSDDVDRYHSNYEAMADTVKDRFAEIHAAVVQDDPDRLTAFRSRWARHCRELRERVVAAGSAGRLLFPPRFADGEPAAVTEPDVLLPFLVTPYLHMTNNRLGATLIDESYLAFILGRTLRDHADSGAFDMAS